MIMSTLELWNSVRTPDPAFTKSFSRGGGFRGTATNAVYLIRMATEKWGPIGNHWGVEIVDERYVTGAPILVDGAKLADETIHVMRINLRTPHGVVPGIGQTLFVGKNKNGLFTDEEAPKKSLTDALSKALSWLGFAADIHLGLWDDNKYVAEVRKRFESKEGESTGEEAATLTAKQIEEVLALSARAKVSEEALIRQAGLKCGRVLIGVSDIPADIHEWLTAALKKRAGKEAA